MQLDNFWILFLYLHLHAIAISLYVHRFLGHKMFLLKKQPKIFLETLLWVLNLPPDPSVGHMHQYHHFTSDTEKDPHSPKFLKKEVLYTNPMLRLVDQLKGLFFAFKKQEVNFSHTYHYKFMYEYPYLGSLFFLIFNIVLFGYLGIAIYLIHSFLAWFFIYTYGMGFVHMFGYRSFKINDNSKNVFPLGVLFAGEELHHNHHKFMNKPNFKSKWYEFDIGYFYIQILCKMKLCILTK